MQIYRLARKISLVKKNLKMTFFWTQIWVSWLWKARDATPLITGHFQWHPRNFMSMTVQMGYVKGRWHQNWVHTALILFSPSKQRNCWQVEFLAKTIRILTEKLSWARTHGILTHFEFVHLLTPGRRSPPACYRSSPSRTACYLGSKSASWSHLQSPRSRQRSRSLQDGLLNPGRNPLLFPSSLVHLWT